MPADVALRPSTVETPARRTEAGRRSWIAAGTYSLLDQGLTSAAGFATAILLARWLEAGAFGAFAVALGVFAIGAALHDALVLEPSSVLGPTRYAHSLPSYVRACVGMHLRVTGIAAAATVGAGAVAAAAGYPALAGALLGLAATIPAVLLLWLLRRAAIVAGRPGRAAAASATALVVVVGGLLALRASDVAAPATAFLALAVASLAGCLPVRRFARPGPEDEHVEIASVVTAHWRYGGWIVAGVIVYAAAMQLQWMIAGAMLGLPAAGALRAMYVVAVPMLQGIAAIATVALPAMARLRSDAGALRRYARVLTVVMTALAAAYELVLIAAYRPIEQLFFGGRYAAYADLIPILGVVPLAGAIAIGSSLSLRARGRTAFYVATGAAALPVAILAGVSLTSAWGVRGAAGAAAATAAASAAATLLVALRRPATKDLS